MTSLRFRAWAKDFRIMFDVDGIVLNDGKGFAYLIKNQGSNKHAQIIRDTIPLDECIVMPATDYEDSDGEEIYVDDIVEHDGCRAVVRFADACFYFEPVDEDRWISDWNFHDDASRFKIIGNVHEDSALLPPSVS